MPKPTRLARQGGSPKRRSNKHEYDPPWVAGPFSRDEANRLLDALSDLAVRCGKFPLRVCVTWWPCIRDLARQCSARLEVERWPRNASSPNRWQRLKRDVSKGQIDLAGWRRDEIRARLDG